MRRAKGSELAQANPNKAITQDDVTQALYQSYYDEAMRTSPYGTGGAVRQGIQAVTAANTLAHALLGAVVAQASGNNALAGAAGEAGGELAARALMEALYPGKKPSELNEEQKQYISTLATIAGGLAAGVVGNTGADAVQGAQSAQVAVENNSLGLLARGCAVAAPCRTKVAEQLLEIGAKAGLAGLAGVAIKEVADKMTSDELDHLITLQMMGNDEITGKYLRLLQDKYASTIAVDPNDIPKLEGLPIPEKNKDDDKYVTPIKDQDKNAGIIPDPIPDSSLLTNTGGTQIIEQKWRDYIVTSNSVKEVELGNLLGTQSKNEVSGSDIKRYADDMKKNGFDQSQPIDVVMVNGKMIIIDGHHRAAAAKLAGIKTIPVRINEVTSKEAADQILIWAAESKTRY
ncbi:VENN motif pre-toxin domain-containing protein [Dickeya zeae]|uniref:VENN motif pre-toxin domain-containing protein n=1 Tax=Dickeya zeae TaxID=204042 RepID=UPI001F268183|nr:VENN motif pre-toxin domain-containing protein [Dickeya zeae]